MPIYIFTYGRLNDQIEHNKLQLHRWLAENVPRLAPREIKEHILHYMDRVQYLLGGQTPPEWICNMIHNLCYVILFVSERIL